MFRMMAIVLLVVGTIVEELFKGEYETTGRSSFIEERKKCVYPFVFHKTAENAESPMFWNVSDRREALNALENMLIRDIYIIDSITAIQSVLTNRSPILPLLPGIHKKSCLTEKQIQKKRKATYWTNDMEEAEQPEKIRRSSLNQSEVNSFEYS